MNKLLLRTTLFALLGSSISYADDEFVTPFAATEINASAGAANTAKSLAASARMAHLAWRGVTPPSEAAIIASCAALSGSTPWPANCSPAGMVQALIANNAGSWTHDNFAETDAAAAVNAQVSHLTNIRTPNVVPLYGHGDHWAVNHRIWKVAGVVVEFDFYDGGPGGEKDSSRQGYQNGEIYADPETWKSTYFKVIDTVPSTDTYYHRYVTLWDPPPGTNFPVVQSLYRQSPSPLAAGTRATPSLARELAVKSLEIAGLTRHQKEWPTIAASTPGKAQEVAGVYPDGTDWNYYLVPLLNQDQMTIGLVMLDKETLRFQMATVLKEPVSLEEPSYTQAQQLAQRSLGAGESLDQGILTWDPAAGSMHASSPMAPYYEFKVYKAGKAVGSKIVRSDDGEVSDLAVSRMGRRLR